MASSNRGFAKPGEKSKEYKIRGTRINEPKAEKVTRAERQRREHNAMLRAPKCLDCGNPRESRAGLRCQRCELIAAQL